MKKRETYSENILVYKFKFELLSFNFEIKRDIDLLRNFN